MHWSGALLDHLARRMRLRAESVLAPLGLRPRHLVALTVLRGRDGITQQALASTLEMDGTNIVGLLNELEAEDLIERRAGEGGAPHGLHARQTREPSIPATDCDKFFLPQKRPVAGESSRLSSRTGNIRLSTPR